MNLINDDTKQRTRKKFQRFIDCAKKKYAECVAPGQSEELLQILNESSDEEQVLPDDIVCAVQMYENSDGMAKLVILSLQNHEKYSRQFLMNAFDCNLYRIKLARKWRNSADKFVLPEKQVFSRNKLNINKSEHFLEFIFSSGLLQDVAYGVTTVKYRSGEKQKIANAILAAKYSHVIALYQENC